MKKVLITGANGFIARTLAGALKAPGFHVIGTSRNPTPLDGFDEVVHGVLGEKLTDVFEKNDIDAIVHCAYDKDESDNIKNAEGTYIWAEQAKENHVGTQIFLSSLSADEDAIAPYGQKKYEVEKWFVSHGHVVFRLGLVIGRGGLFGKIVESVKKSPVVPLIDGGKALTYLTDVDTLSEVIRDTITESNDVSKGRVTFLQQKDPVMLVDILKEVRKQLKLSRLLLPIPYWPVFLVLSVAEKLKFLKLGINTNNLKGMRQLGLKTFDSDLTALGYIETPFEKLIGKSLD